ncbi:uncharacterized protein KY384_001621 [Bacidia gigantensis]|uniref:uncharacterized protein n=1 Tax=Bacidia gigantensis TaxID=2732470 RepID=UPI001D045800|nr:uncharacterized protein KY384_001621 [Bacidia gigantensis]KAG8533880.1 hypothetical protein KY384_001621 [Bacidia gigantensis]
MPPGGKRPERRTGKSRFRPSDAGLTDVVPSLERTQDNLDSLYRGLILPQATHKYIPLGPHEIRLLHLLPADNKGDMLYAELKNVRLDDTRLQYLALSYTWGYEEPTQRMWIRKPELPLRAPRTPIDRFINHARETIMEKQKLKPNATFYVRPNLGEALRHLRNYSGETRDPAEREPQTIVLWIDWICINQNDGNEKSTQVRMMADIYKRAADVCIWLGKESEDSSIGLNFVNRVPQHERDDMFSAKDSTPQQWGAFVALMRKEWFRRRWVVQELALAKQAYLMCGDASVDWFDYCAAVETFFRQFETIAALYGDSPDFKQRLDALGNMRAAGAAKMIAVTNEFVRGSKDRLKSLEALVSELTMFEAGDPRDTVYALVALARDIRHDSQRPMPDWQLNTSQVNFVVDYKKNILQVFKDFIAFCIIGSARLDIICRKWAPNRNRKHLTVKERLKYRGRPPPVQEVKLPSWIGLLQDSAFGHPRSGPPLRVGGNSLVDTNQRYNACGGSRAEISFGEVDAIQPQDEASLDLRKRSLPENPSTHKVSARETLSTSSRRASDGTIYVRGFRIRAITKITHRLYEGMIPSECLIMGGCKDEIDDDDEEVTSIPEELWRTLVANKTPEGDPPPRSYLDALSLAMERRNPNGDIHTAELIRQGKPPWMVEFLTRVQEVIWDKRFFLLEDTGDLSYCFGIGPSGAQIGDFVCVLLGCSVPVILSPVNANDSRYGYKLVGEAYLHGMMDAIADWSATAVQPEIKRDKDFLGNQYTTERSVRSPGSPGNRNPKYRPEDPGARGVQSNLDYK